MLQWCRGKELEKDIAEAIARFKVRFGYEPVVLLVPKCQEQEFLNVKPSLNVRSDRWMKPGDFGLQ